MSHYLQGFIYTSQVLQDIFYQQYVSSFIFTIFHNHVFMIAHVRVHMQIHDGDHIDHNRYHDHRRRHRHQRGSSWFESKLEPFDNCISDPHKNGSTNIEAYIYIYTLSYMQYIHMMGLFQNACCFDEWHIFSQNISGEIFGKVPLDNVPPEKT